jgi:hypothetical protein
MTKLLWISMLSLLISGTLSQAVNPSSTSIHELLKQGKITVKPLTNGGFNEASITLSIKNLADGRRVLIPKGTRFKSVLGDEQDLLVPQDLIVDLPRKGEKDLSLNAYCMQHSNLAPQENQVFVMTEEQDEQLLKVLNFMDGKTYSPSVIQDAIWAVTDELDVAGISMNEPGEKELREFICNTLGIENVWYDLDRQYEQTAQREIIPRTTEVSGDIAYEADETGEVVMQVTEEDGTVIRELGGGMPVTRIGSYKFHFSMKVQGWESGLYFVQLKIQDNVFHKVAFEVA